MFKQAIKKKIGKDVSVEENIFAFQLNMTENDLRKNKKALDLIRDYVRNDNKQAIKKLQRLRLLDWKDKGKNITVVDGRTVLAELLTGSLSGTADGSDDGDVNYIALGTGSNSITKTDSKLESEQDREQYVSRSNDKNIAFIDTVFPGGSGKLSGTFTRLGTFIDATATTDSGEMLTHYDTGGWTKEELKSLFVTVKYTFK